MSASVRGNGAMMLVGEGPISAKKLLSEWAWPDDVLLLGFYVRLQTDTIEPPPSDPKILGDVNLANSPVLNHGNYTMDLRIIQEPRGRMCH